MSAQGFGWLALRHIPQDNSFICRTASQHVPKKEGTVFQERPTDVQIHTVIPHASNINKVYAHLSASSKGIQVSLGLVYKWKEEWIV